MQNAGKIKHNVVKFIDDYSRGYFVSSAGINTDLVLVVEGPYKLPKIAVLTTTAFSLLRERALRDRQYLDAPVLIDAAAAAYLTDTFIGSLDLVDYL